MPVRSIRVMRIVQVHSLFMFLMVLNITDKQPWMLSSKGSDASCWSQQGSRGVSPVSCAWHFLETFTLWILKFSANITKQDFQHRVECFLEVLLSKAPAAIRWSRFSTKGFKPKIRATWWSSSRAQLRGNWAHENWNFTRKKSGFVPWRVFVTTISPAPLFCVPFCDSSEDKARSALNKCDSKMCSFQSEKFPMS